MLALPLLDHAADLVAERLAPGISLVDAADALVVTGPTFTNVNDFRAILVDAPGGKGGFST